MPVRAKMESKAFWVVDGDVLSSLRSEANDLSLDTTYAMIKGLKRGEIQRVYLPLLNGYICVLDVRVDYNVHGFLLRNQVGG